MEGARGGRLSVVARVGGMVWDRGRGAGDEAQQCKVLRIRPCMLPQSAPRTQPPSMLCAFTPSAVCTDPSFCSLRGAPPHMNPLPKPASAPFK
eukprot:472200-Rhodomonas_salina.1